MTIMEWFSNLTRVCVVTDDQVDECTLDEVTHRVDRLA